ncbi:glycerol-3-phosphate 1-O-acyltransferase PlsY [Nitrosophilus kaiyonis]|uniref:glycerol-3-phosphate 1-O-acyltransferase PlsY n=1 Tax=Nitrosophilus kaiyonis TaxID=2930200 RepID=UPI0024914EEA|nr:glycerol-3-phosphate 1-O-acyltransferase PlsY [Nitrosophilus kaiyonis]
MDFITNINVWFYFIAYIVGGIPFGLILAKIFAKTNIKEAGSKSIGATNVLRVVKEKDPVLAKKLAVATIILDALKGMIVILIAKAIGLSFATQWAIAVLAVLGHCFSPFLKFEGGKGIATGVGVLLIMLPVETVLALIAWAITAKVTKISSLSSLTGLFVLLVSSFVIHPQIPHIKSHAPIILIAAIVVYKHIPNIIRLIKKEEKAAV